MKQSVPEFLRDVENILSVGNGAQDGCYVTAIVCQQTQVYMPQSHMHTMNNSLTVQVIIF